MLRIIIIFDSGKKILLCWFPSHVGILYNGKAETHDL